jgi:DNA-binding transcriptional LysR family regulator
MHVTPGAVSQQVRQLERSLNVELFLRQHRRVILTDSGRLLAGRLTELFDSIDRAVVEVAGDPRSKKLRLRVSPTFAIRWLVPRLTSFYEQYQDFEIEVGTYVRQEDVAIEDVDFVVRHGRGNWDDAVSDLLFWDALSPVCCPAIAKRLRSPKDLASQNLLHSMLRAEGWDLWLRSQGVGVLRPKHSINLSSAAVSYQAAIDGQGVALGQQAYLRDDITGGRLVQPFDHVLHTGSGYWLSFAKHKANQPNIRLFREWIRSLVS